MKAEEALALKVHPSGYYDKIQEESDELKDFLKQNPKAKTEITWRHSKARQLRAKHRQQKRKKKRRGKGGRNRRNTQSK